MKYAALLLAIVLISFSSFAQRTMWGMAAAKGTINGTIFKTDSAGNGYTDVYTFANPLNGLDPYGSLMQATDGKLYGLTSRGGTYGFGVLFQVDPSTGVYTKKHDFDSVNGKSPYGSLVQAPNGKLYGMTYGGGAYIWPAKDRGVIFEFDLSSGIFTNKEDLLPKNAANPYGSLVLGTDGNLYGLTSGGGGDATGMIFQYNYLLDSFTHMGSFISGPPWEGYAPRSTMVQAANGIYYGLSRYGQAMGSGGGVIFKFDAAAAWDRMSFVYKLSELAPDSVNGYETKGSLIQASDNKLYGMAQYGGANGAGTIFSYDVSTNTFAKRHDLDAATEGYAPYGTLMQASNGMLYGLTTSEGGQARLFQFDISTGSFTIKANVTGTPYYTSLIEVTPMPTKVALLQKQALLHVSPNPTKNTVTFSVEATTQNPTYQLIDAQGRVLISGKASTFNTLNIAHLAPGSYVLCLIANGQTSTQTIIKE